MKKGGAKHKLALAIIVCGFAFPTFGVLDSFLTLDSSAYTNGVFGFTLNGQYGARYVIEASADLQTWAPVLTNNGPDPSRPLTIKASGDSAFYRAKAGPPFIIISPIGLFAETNINFSGNNIVIDSFDSADPINFPGGQWNGAHRKANGH